MIQAYGYLRVSSVGQVDGTGLDRQRDSIQLYADKHGIEIVGWYSDTFTGTEANRPAFIKMLGCMMANGVKTVIIESLDRLSRDLLVQITLLAKLEAEHLTLISATTEEDVTASMRDDPMRKALVQIQGVFAELDRNQLTKKLKKGRDRIWATKGRCEGRKPFGHFDDEKPTLARMRELHQQFGQNQRGVFDKIARQLNEEGFKNRRGGTWTRQTTWAALVRPPRISITRTAAKASPTS
jgi:site-specific DNA recombinase